MSLCTSKLRPLKHKGLEHISQSTRLIMYAGKQAVDAVSPYEFDSMYSIGGYASGLANSMTTISGVTSGSFGGYTTAKGDWSPNRLH